MPFCLEKGRYVSSPRLLTETATKSHFAHDSGMAKGSKDCLHETWAAIGSDITGALAHRLNHQIHAFYLT